MNEQDLTELAASALESDGEYTRVAIREGVLAGCRLTGVWLEESLLAKVRAAGLTLIEPRLNDVAFRDCDLANGAWEKARATAVQWFKCRLTGWNAAGATFRNVQFTGSKINLAVFHDASFKDCRFEACDLCEADFQAARLKGVVFRHCDLRGSRFAAASLQAVDFGGSHLDGAQMDAGSLAGNAFDPSQLLDVARVLGLVVRSVEDD